MYVDFLNVLVLCKTSCIFGWKIILKNFQSFYTRLQKNKSPLELKKQSIIGEN